MREFLLWLGHYTSTAVSTGCILGQGGKIPLAKQQRGLRKKKKRQNDEGFKGSKQRALNSKHSSGTWGLLSAPGPPKQMITNSAVQTGRLSSRRRPESPESESGAEIKVWAAPRPLWRPEGDLLWSLPASAAAAALGCGRVAPTLRASLSTARCAMALHGPPLSGWQAPSAPCLGECLRLHSGPTWVTQAPPHSEPHPHPASRDASFWCAVCIMQ